MIKCLVLGEDFEVQKYTSLLRSSKYFEVVLHNATTLNEQASFPNTLQYDALFLLGHTTNAFDIFSEAMKAGKSIYLTFRNTFYDEYLDKLVKLNQESKSMVYIENNEFEHPLIVDFLSNDHNRVFARYSKSLPTITALKPTLFSALCLFSTLSNLNVKKIGLDILHVPEPGKNPNIIIELAMYNRSVLEIVLINSNNKEFTLHLETKRGNFKFDFIGNYLENIHGNHFKTKPISDEELLQRSIESFAMHIILNKQPQLNIQSYKQVVTILFQIETILQKNSMLS